jgi:hypothetical protein
MIIFVYVYRYGASENPSSSERIICIYHYDVIRHATRRAAIIAAGDNNNKENCDIAMGTSLAECDESIEDCFIWSSISLTDAKRASLLAASSLPC